MHVREFDGNIGSVETLWLEAPSIAGNLLGASTRRRVDIWLPAGHDPKGLPLLIDLAAWGSGGPAHSNWEGLRENLPERLDRLLAAGRLKPCVVAMPDCYLRLGGNQFVNSPVAGNWMDFLSRDLLTLIEKRYNCGGPGRRGLFGKSSGGYGALVNAMKRPEIWAAAACLSGDMGFHLMFRHELAQAATVIAGKYDGSIQNFVEALEADPNPGWDKLGVMMVIAQSAFYDPQPKLWRGLSLPVDLETGDLIPNRWANWMQWDPVQMVDGHARELGQLKGLWIECGRFDEHFLHFGARAFHRELKQRSIPHDYHEFDGGHRGLDYRLDESLPWMADLLSGKKFDQN